jgi:hypothetical protein
MQNNFLINFDVKLSRIYDLDPSSNHSSFQFQINTIKFFNYLFFRRTFKKKILFILKSTHLTDIKI